MFCIGFFPPVVCVQYKEGFGGVFFSFFDMEYLCCGFSCNFTEFLIA